MTTPPYLLVSDIHAFAWSQFSRTNPDGLNSRLHIILEELLRAAEELKERGGNLMVVAGDTFHVRGKIEPEVFNPVHNAFERIAAMGIRIIFIPGNHDLAGKETTALGNAIQTLGAIEGVQVATTTLDEPVNRLILVPWHSTIESLKAEIERIKNVIEKTAPYDVSDCDLIIHAGIDGVLIGLPDHGLTAEECASWGFKRVFAGHYHDHKVMEGGKVVSIGATTHQTWNDIGTKAGYLLVYPDRFEYRASHAPSFVEITGDTDPDEYASIVDGNYVRIRSMKLADPEVNLLRKALIDMGARGVAFQITRETVTARDGKVASAGITIDQSVENYVKKMEGLDDMKAVIAECHDVLSTVRSLAA